MEHKRFFEYAGMFNLTSLRLYSITKTATEIEQSKINIVSLTGHFYEPLGFLSPIIIGFKMLNLAIPRLNGMSYSEKS